MSSTFGNVLRLSIFGQSHSPAIGCSLDGIPAGIAVNQEKLQAFLDRRAPGRDETATKRREADVAHIIAGVVDGHTIGAPIAAIIENTNTRSKDYSELRRKPRPGHADYPARVKYHNMHDVAGSGHFSGRLTAPLCIAGGIALQALEARGIQVMAHVAQIGGISDLPMGDMVYRGGRPQGDPYERSPCIDAAAAGRMREGGSHSRARRTRQHRRHRGVRHLRLACGHRRPHVRRHREPHRENRVWHSRCKGAWSLAWALPWPPCAAASLTIRIASTPRPAEIEVESNNAGGILGGISTGAPVMWRMAVKPTPSIGREQQTVDMDAMENAELSVHGRHDPRIVPEPSP